MKKQKSLKAWAVVWKDVPEKYRINEIDGSIRIYEKRRDATYATRGNDRKVRRVKIVFDD